MLLSQKLSVSQQTSASRLARSKKQEGIDQGALKTVSSTIREFTDLKAWQESHKVVLMIYKISKKFPSDEKFGLTSQMRRAAVSITSNIAEGFGRQGQKEKSQFYMMGRGSVLEIKNQLIIARDIGIINSKEYDTISEQTTIAHKVLNGLIKSINGYGK